MARHVDEVPLEGGTANRGLVVRVGNTVRRPLRPTSAATHALLQHLADVGFEGAPRFLGIDDQGREVLSYIDGSAVTPPYPDWALSDAALISVAHLLRHYHDAVHAFDTSGYVWPESPPSPFDGELVSHNDPNLDNVIFRNGQAVAFIDFDLASPGSRLWDVATASRLWVPLRDKVDIADSRRRHMLPRFRAMVDAYGIAQSERKPLVDAVDLNHDWLYSMIRSEADQGNLSFVEYWDNAEQKFERARNWYRAHHQLLVETLTAPAP